MNLCFFLGDIHKLRIHERGGHQPCRKWLQVATEAGEGAIRSKIAKEAGRDDQNQKWLPWLGGKGWLKFCGYVVYKWCLNNTIKKKRKEN